MAKPKLIPIPNMAIFFLLNLLVSSSPSLAQDINKSGLQTYIVHVRKPPNTVFLSSEDRRRWHRSFLPSSILSSGNGDDRIVYSYEEVISGFAAVLSEEEVKTMEEKEGFLFAHPERLLSVQTTHTPSVLGLHQGTDLWVNSNMGKGVIIGVLDSGLGIVPHRSFRDKGMPSPPSKWNGSCKFNASVCNKKIIAARSFVGANTAPMDEDDGHGTHVASTAGGMFAKSASFLGYASGTAAGMAPLAHLAIYKVCTLRCAGNYILAGIEAAIKDGVDVINLSLGGSSQDFYRSVIDIGSFRAMQKGIFVSCAAGNEGPYPYTLGNEAPWYLTVGASTTDRTISVAVMLGNGQEISGEGIFQAQLDWMPIVYPGANGDAKAASCQEGSLSGIDVKGKIVLCQRRPDQIEGPPIIVVVEKAGGAAYILMNSQIHGFSTQVEYSTFPFAFVSFSEGSKIKAYINSSATAAKAKLVMKGTMYGKSPSLMVASISSRGPTQFGNMLKPDITGPGVGILAAYPFPRPHAPKSSAYFFNSGTSMATPHLSGVAALLKSSHPTWSPAAIKSAIMTTADVVDHKGNRIVDEQHAPADLFAIGAGQVNPSKANHPGLVYDLQPDDYIPYLCGLGYSDSEVEVIVGRHIDCNTYSSIQAGELNYPSFHVILAPAQSQTFTRTVTNVGDANSTYAVDIFKPHGLYVRVSPHKLFFSNVNQTMKYTVTLTRGSNTNESPEFVEGYLKWVSSSSKYVVRSPISVRFYP